MLILLRAKVRRHSYGENTTTTSSSSYERRMFIPSVIVPHIQHYISHWIKEGWLGLIKS
jgi:hypothetical protein